MGRLLEALRTDSETRQSANPAKVANLTPVQPERFADSQDSQRARVAMRSRLLTIASAECIKAALIDLPDEELAACAGCSDDVLRTYLRARARSVVMDAGGVPNGYTKACHCTGCGPVLLWPECPEELAACPWCCRRKAGVCIPRPAKTSGRAGE